MEGWFDDLLTAVPFSLGRVMNSVLIGGFGSVIPAALLSGSGGSGNGFQEVRFVAIVAGATLLAAIIGALTSPRSGPR